MGGNCCKVLGKRKAGESDDDDGGVNLTKTQGERQGTQNETLQATHEESMVKSMKKSLQVINSNWRFSWECEGYGKKSRTNFGVSLINGNAVFSSFSYLSLKEVGGGAV
ncbi:hypothetical protein CCACVL1_10131 [Corchorus capsularis]|uniref:Uncharacterized protein n=1 Tax=Corchorus capsularis TaxID=210143 RepID=A0A1R3ISH7_COCAP|nr:hypothetical protein CCACVL1_10131 [Corchorus capsularis]